MARYSRCKRTTICRLCKGGALQPVEWRSHRRALPFSASPTPQTQVVDDPRVLSQRHTHTDSLFSCRGVTMAVSQLPGIVGTLIVIAGYVPQVRHLIKEHCSAGVSTPAF